MKDDDQRGYRRDWRAIRRAYETRELTILELCRQYGISKSSLYARAKREGWHSRRQRSRRHGAEKAHGFSTLLQDAQSLLAHRLGSGADDSLADLEKQIRLMKSLVSTAKMVEQMEKDAAKAGADSKRPAIVNQRGVGGDINDEADRMRKELARRLKEFRENGTD